MATAAGDGGDDDRSIGYRQATVAARMMATMTSTATQVLKIANFSSSLFSSSSSSSSSPQSPCCSSDGSDSDDQEKQQGVGGPDRREEINGEAAAAELELVSAAFSTRGENARSDLAASTFVRREEKGGGQKRIFGGGGVIAVRECEATIVHDFDDWDDDDDHRRATRGGVGVV